jgi:hypothetical protein
MQQRTGTTPAGVGPAERPEAHGYDEPLENRPGVPMEAEPRVDGGAHQESPAQQRSEGTHLHRKGLDKLTPVYGTAQPPRGASGVLRRAAYQIPEHDFRHWMTLLVADRVDILEHRLEDLARGRVKLDTLARQARTSPLALLLAAGAAGYLVRRALR